MKSHEQHTHLHDQQSYSNKKSYFAFRDTPGATGHLSSTNSNGAKSAKDLINLRPDGGRTVALLI